MVIMELIFAAFLVFTAGSYLGNEKAKESAPKKKTEKRYTPDEWPPIRHKELLKTCGIMCGEGNLKSYTVLYGKCVCKG